jgi:hypothetical protein
VLHDARHLDNEDIGGSLLEQYQRTWLSSSATLWHAQAVRGEIC